MKKNNFFLQANNSITYIFFIGLFAICWFQIEDYGVTLDDEIYYLNGLNTYIYAKQLLLSFYDHGFNLEQLRSKIEGWPIVFELLLVFICDVFDITQIDKIYLTAHRLNFVIFFSSLIIFYKLIQNRFENNLLSLVSVIFFILSPRIFAESFYNSRDIFFMTLFIFYAYFGYNFINNKKILDTIIFAFFTALLINAKILGLIPFAIFCLVYLYSFLHTNKKLAKERRKILFYFLFCIIFVYILWPFLWNNPFKNLLFAFQDMLKTHENLVIINYYFGNYISSDVMPWHYRLTWFLITTPLAILILFIFGLIIVSKNLFSVLNKSLDSKYIINNKQFLDLFLFLVFFGSFFVVAEFNNSKFGGWRHLYYTYPIVIYFSIYFINFFNNFSPPFKFLIIFLITVNLVYNLYWSFKNNPHQYVYFNSLAKNYSVQNFDLDWWGISHKSSLEYILKNDKNSKIKIYAEGFTSLKDSYLYLDPTNKNRVIIAGFEDAKYIINNNKKRIRNNNNFDNENFELFYQLNIDGGNVTSIYKRKK